MSATDPREEFCSMVDDWWCQLFAMRLGCDTPSERVKFLFISFVEEQCAEVGSWKVTDDDLCKIFPDFIERLAEW